MAVARVLGISSSEHRPYADMGCVLEAWEPYSEGSRENFAIEARIRTH